MRGYFVTGTDTGVGKTVLSAALTIRLEARYWKPIQTGSDNDTADVQWLAKCEVIEQGIRLPDPVSPHLAAQKAKTSIELDKLASIFDDSFDFEGFSHKICVVEGAGGVLVPINESELMVDLMLRLSLPVIVATRTTLGTINHTLLTLEALRSRSLSVAGVVMIGERSPDNRHAIEHYGKVNVLAEMPNFDPLTPEALRSWAQTHFHLPHPEDLPA
jgi:dethiobiotin synthase